MKAGMSVTENIAGIEERIQKACDRAGRKRDEVTLMGVTKFVPIALIEEAYRAGIRCFGESRVKEGIEKFETFRNGHQDISVHMIGSLQRNKAKAAALFFDCIQSVDREELIDELAKHADAEKPVKVLLELHTGEETKSGFADFDDLFRAAEKICRLSGLKPAGLMTMAPYTEDTELIRSSFRRVVEAQKELAKRWPDENWSCLSMGMSNDFEIAVEEGSNLLRIGSLIFKDL
jgi:pyridoxal phosphate enzyme (YggS family)